VVAAVINADNKWLPSVYFVFGQIGWFGCVLSAAHGAPWIGALLVILLIGLHLAWVARPLEELTLVLLAMVIGGAWDSVLVATGLLIYPSGMLVQGFAPYWIPALWAMFAAQLNLTYEWLKPRLWLAALLGAVAGPLSFRAGAALGALRFSRPLPALLTLGAGWMVLLPLLIVLSRRFNGVRPRLGHSLSGDGQV